MKQIIRYISVVMMLLACVMASAQSTIKVMSIINGAVNVDKLTASKGDVITITVSPNDGYYFQKENLEVVKTVNPNVANTRSDIPVSNPIAISGNDPDDLSIARAYKFIVPDDGYEIQISATFTARTIITDNMVSISATSFTYSGSSQKPSISVTGLNEGDDYNVEFEGTSWIAAGTYLISITGRSKCKGTVNKSFIISPKIVNSSNIMLSETTCTYDGSAKEPTVTVMDGGTTIPTTEYSVSYTNNINVGTATITVTDVEGGNYTVSGSKTFTISSANGSLTPPTGKSDLVYNGAAQNLIIAGSSTTGTIEYSLDGTNYATTIPQGKNAESYTVYYRVKGDANHNDIAAQHFDVTIAPKTVDNPTITLNPTTCTYDGTEKEPTVTVKDGNTVISDIEYTVSYSNNTNVGTATVTITDVEGGNYTVSGSTTFAISSANGSLTPPTGKSNLVYDGTAQDLITAGTTNTGTLQYSLDGETYSTDIPQGTDAKTYKVYYRVIGDANHSDIEAQSFNVTIAAKTVNNPTITLSQTSYTYDGNAKEPTVTVKDGVTTISATEYTVSYTNNTNVGTATVSITDKEGGNYNVNGSATFTISSTNGTLTPPSAFSNLIYTGKAQNLITAGSTNTGTMQYSLDGTTYATSIPQGTDAGSYTVYYRVKGDANHNDIAAQHFDVKIAKAPLKVSVGNYEIVEGEAIPAFDAKYEGFVNNETADVLTTKPSISCEATNSSPAGEYKVKASGAEAKNYEISYVDGKLTILAKKFEAGGDDNKDEDDTATYQITSQGGGSDTTPTVAITDDAGVSDAFDIPEEVVHNGVTYKVTEIGEGTFENNTNLKEVSIPSSITSIGDKAFKGCSNLKSITLYITTPISLAVAGTRGAMTRADGNSVFDGVDKATCILYVPEGSVDLYKAAPVWKDFQNIFAIGTTGINGIIMNNEPQDIYDLQGRKVRAKSASLEGLRRGIYIINGKKISIK